MKLPCNVKKIIEREIQPFKNYTVNHIVSNYQFGVSDMLLRFRRGSIGLLANGELINSKRIVDVRCRLLASIMDELYKEYTDLMENLDLVIPVCFSDQSDTYLQDIPCLVFSKRAYSNNILIPSPNDLAGHWELDHVRAWDKPLYQKSDIICFVGSFTGRQDSIEALKENSRVQIAIKASELPYYFCKILRPPLEPEENFSNLVERCKKIYPDIKDHIFLNQEEKISINQQLEFKFQLCADGHTCAWARLPWQMASNSVPLKVRNRQTSNREWYYSLLDGSKHFLELDINEVDDAYSFLVNNPQIQEDINENGKEFVDQYINRDMAKKVLLQTLLLLNEKQDNRFLVVSEEMQQAQAEEQPQELP